MAGDEASRPASPISVHVYSDRLAKAVSSCNNYGEQHYSDDLTAVHIVSPFLLSGRLLDVD